MKKIISIVLALTVMMMLAPSITSRAAAPNWQDSGIPVAVAPNEDGVFEIYTPEQLAWVAQTVNSPTCFPTFSGYTIKLMNDIDLSAKEWTPIGCWNGTENDTDKEFSGTFDGNGHKVTGLIIGTASANNSDYEYVGLFGYSSGLIQNTGIENVSIYSNKDFAYIGGLVGYENSGTIIDCYATGNVTGGSSAQVGGLIGNQSYGTITNSYATGNATGGSNAYIGGLAGFQVGTITDSYATGNVTGGHYMGGLVGYQMGTTTNSYATGNVTGGSSDYVGGLAGFQGEIITNSYATGNVSGGYYMGGLVGYKMGTTTNSYATGNVTGGSSDYVGGLVGYQENGTITNSYWNKGAIHMVNNTIIADANKKGVGVGSDTTISKTAEELKSQAFVDLLNNNNTNITMSEWFFDYNTKNQGYPLLSKMGPNPNKYWVSNALPIIENNNTFEVTTPGQLAWILLQVSKGVTFAGKTIKLINDIDLSSKEWTPIGGWNGAETDETKKFSGTFDGNGKRVTGLIIGTASANNSDYAYVGLFGYADGTIKNIGVENVMVYSSYASAYVGGLVGYEYYGTITNCYVTGNVTGRYCVGGLVGVQNSGAIVNSYATGNVTGGYSGAHVGGLVGYQYYGSITSCYATGNVTGGRSASVGGLVGYRYSSFIDGSYWNKDAIHILDSFPVSAANKKGVGSSIVGSGPDTSIGKTALELKQKSTFTDWDFTSIWAINGTGSINNGFPYLLSYEPSSTVIKYGDINDDGAINIADAVMASEIAVGYSDFSAEQINRANVSSKEDTTVDVADVVLLVERIVGGITPFPVELQ